MEFLIGDHCSLSECKQLDFLPFKCNACSLIYCKDHFNYTKHNCEKAQQYDHQVPICPVCNKPVSYRYGDQPDINMNRHLEEECSMKLKTNKIYKNKCSIKNCKEKLPIELICDGCRLSYCLKHRHATDHDCSEKYSNDKLASSSRKTQASSSAGAAAMQRLMNNSINKTSNFVGKIGNMINAASNSTSSTQANLNRPNVVSVNKIQGNLNEDEALSIAIQKSLNEQSSPQLTTNSLGTRNSPIVISDENEDSDLARALELSKQEYEKNKEKCSLS